MQSPTSDLLIEPICTSRSEVKASLRSASAQPALITAAKPSASATLTVIPGRPNAWR